MELSRATLRCCRALRPRHVRGDWDHDRIFGVRERFGEKEHKKMTRDVRPGTLWELLPEIGEQFLK